MTTTTKSFHIDEGIVEERDDWLDSLAGEFRQSFFRTIRSLPVDGLHRLPPPKPGRVPFGHELRVLSRYRRGESVLFDESAFWRLYHSRSQPNERLIYRALYLTEPLSDADWSALLGDATFRDWIDRRLLRSTPQGWTSRFRICPIGHVVLLGDAEKPKLLRRVLIGQDSFNMARFMEQRSLARCGRYLDVGPGSGVVLLNVARHAEEALGLDLNPRAVAISRLNADLNEIPNCTVREGNALEVGDTLGRFDLITWNTPFVFLPEECRNTHLDAFGGHLGLELPLNFMRRLPELLTPNGVSYLGMSAPITRSDGNVLEAELNRLAPELGLDIVNHVIQAYWHVLYREFHEAHGIVKNELVFLEIRRGRGTVRRVDPPLRTRMADKARQVAYRIWR